MSSDDPWKEIISPGTTARVSARRTDADHRWDFFWGKDSEARCLLVLVTKKQAELAGQLPHLRGMEVRVNPAPDSALVWVLRDTTQRQIFRKLCDDIMASAAAARTEQEAVTRAIQRTWRWHHLLKGADARLLSEEEQKGLIGEMLVLEKYLIPLLNVKSAVDAWRGPLGSPKDFEIGNICIEAKARRSAATPHVYISSEYQLDASGVERFFLHVADLARAPDGATDGFSLGQMAQRMRDQIRMLNESVAERFSDLLQAAGFDFEDDYSMWNWSEGESRILEVHDDFPRIEASRLPGGVADVRYKLALLEVERFTVTAAELEAAIRGTRDAGRA